MIAPCLFIFDPQSAILSVRGRTDAATMRHLYIVFLYGWSSVCWSDDYLTSDDRLLLMSLNDGEVPMVTAPFDPDAVVADSITVIELSPDSPPQYRHAYGDAASSIVGPPYATALGRFGIVVNHRFRLGLDAPEEITGPNQISVVDLTGDLEVVETIPLDGLAFMARPLDSERFLVASAGAWQVIQLSERGAVDNIDRWRYRGFAYGFDVAADGTIVAVVADEGDLLAAPKRLAQFQFDGHSIRFVGNVEANEFRVESPVAVRIAPDGVTALALNGLGGSDGHADDVLVLKRRGGRFEVAASIRQVADGLESIAIHPSGQFAVVSCLNMHGRHDASHLAVIDLEEEPMLLSYTAVEPIPEGIEFSPDGKMLFVGSTHASHISVFDVVGKTLRRQPYVLATGFGHASMALVRADEPKLTTAESPVQLTSPEVIRRQIAHLEASYNAGDAVAALEVFHDDVTFDWGSIPANPWYGLGEGKEEILEGWKWNGEHLSDSSYEIIETIIEGNISLSRAQEKFVVRATGRTVDCPVLAEHHWKDGKIIFWREYFCQAEFLDALGMIDQQAPEGFRR